ncbi:hypothetical protein [Spiroplasma taiwanense]|uniref:hypothetical protein n=1 Tax=Spiroplasma taiwanense TaxID=2145 RepID=UPI00035A3470|nr:hypothetical protein [Spiroplasma taiwanense]
MGNKENPNLSKLKSDYISLIIVLIFFVSFVSSSLIITWDNPEGKSYLETSYLSSDTSIILVYLIYISMIISVLRNRKTKKIEVKPVKGGFVTSIISVSMLILMMIYII